MYGAFSASPTRQIFTSSELIAFDEGKMIHVYSKQVSRYQVSLLSAVGPLCRAAAGRAAYFGSLSAQDQSLVNGVLDDLNALLAAIDS